MLLVLLACHTHFYDPGYAIPTFTFSKETLGLDGNAFSEDIMTIELISRVDHILQNHSGIGVKTLNLDLLYCNNVDSGYLNNWLHIAVTPGIEKLILRLPPENKAEYNFPCSLLSNGSGNSIRHIRLSYCAFHPTVGLGCLRSLTGLDLCFVRISGDELECLLSSSFALEWLKLLYCREIICLKIPSLLQRLSFLDVCECKKLQVVESNAPNLSTFYFQGALARISLGGSLQVKNLRMICLYQANIVCFARTELVSIVPNVEALSIMSPAEMVNTPMLPSKFLHLKYLGIYFGGVAVPATYDYFSLVSFLDACPYLETFILTVSQRRMEHASIFDEPAHPRQMPEHRHDNLKSAKITGFCSAKSLVELTCHIIENATSLDCLTLDTTSGHPRCSVNNSGKCYRMGRDILLETQKALLAIRRYIVGKVPSPVRLSVLEPCGRCNTVPL